MRYVANYTGRDQNMRGTADFSYLIQINSAGSYEFDEPSGPVHRPEGRNDWYLSYQHEGRMKIKTQEGYRDISAGDVFLYRPDEEQYYGQIDQEPFKNYWVHFTGFGTAEIIAAAGLAEGRVFHVGHRINLVGLYEQIIDELMFRKSRYALITTAILIQLIGNIGRLHNQSKKEVKQDHLVVKKSLRTIHQSVQEPVAVSELAAVNHMSTSRFSAVFRETVGLSPQQYMINFRLSKACELLKYSQLSIRQIAGLCGFSDQLYFSRVFKKYMHKSPVQWRKENHDLKT